MKYKYSLNNKNQLFIKTQKHKAPIPVRGAFSLDKENRLIYWLNEPVSWRRKYNLPSKVSFTGNWRLNPNYDLELNLDETGSQYRQERLIFKGEIISSDRDALIFEIISQDNHGLDQIRLLKFSGSWQADEFNRIIFLIKKKTAPDVITFEGAWRINKNQQITYIYEKTDLKRKTRLSHAMTFEGFWEITNRERLTYILSRSSGSYFDFRVQIESPNLHPGEGLIKYRIGIGLRKDKPSQTRLIYLYGTWKFSHKAGLVFQMDYGKSRFRDIEFGTNFYLHKKDEIIFLLANKKNEPLGLSISFTHRFLKENDAETFLRLKDILHRKEAVIEAGVRIPF